MKSIRVFSAIVSALLACGQVLGNSVVDAWTSAPMGIAVTKCEYSTRGVSVQFETDLEPPYYVGVYRMNEVGLARRFPIKEVQTDTTSAFVPVDVVMMPAVFVQVMTPGAAYLESTNETYRRELTPSEIKSWRTAIENADRWRNDDPGTTYELRDDGVMELIDNYLWAGFVKTAETNLSFTLSGKKMVDSHLVPHEYSFHIGDGKSDVGTGYRILMFEDLGMCQAQRAYSAKTNMSDIVVIPCGFRVLTSHDGYVYTTDWEGRRYFQKVTNRVDHVFGGGLR